MTRTSVREGVRIAIDSLRANKIRAGLTVLGIVIGVATVMAMAGIIGGVRDSVTGEIAALGPNNFVVERFDQTQIRFVSDGAQRPPWEGLPRITPAEGRMIEALESVRSATASVSASGELRLGNQTLADVELRGRGHLWPEYARGEFVSGRNFLPAEEVRENAVLVLSERAAESLFGLTDPVGETIRVSGQSFQVIGVYREYPNIFSGLARPWAVVPAGAAIRRLGANPDWYALLVVPEMGFTQSEAMDQVTAALRGARGLNPADENNFALIRQEAFAELFSRLTGVFFLVMLVLSSIGLLVGGVGVVAIMMISVTERTREIGVRKALGATRREILWQFLVEAMTVTLIGGSIGILLGGGGALLLEWFTPIPASVPLWSVGAAIGVSAISGIGFGLYPASRAAALDPVEALRYE
jgi:putative ABC transport system permease protein